MNKQLLLKKVLDDVSKMTESQRNFMAEIMMLDFSLIFSIDMTQEEEYKLNNVNREINHNTCSKCNINYKCCKINNNEHCYYYNTQLKKCNIYKIRPTYCRIWFCEQVKSLQYTFKRHGLDVNILDLRYKFKNNKKTS